MMASEHTEALEAFRRLAVEQRRQLVRDLASPQDRGGAQDLREMFLKVQTTIEGIDRALEDERAMSGGVESSPL
jgi:Skp family chaperone for outer membrane proteins